MKLVTTDTYDKMTMEQVAQVVNGCGPQGTFVTFDKILGVNLFNACSIHDIDYGVGGNELDRLEADRRFIVNILITILMGKGWHQWWRIPLCFPFFIAVRMSGYRHFKYHAGNSKPRLWDLRAAWIPVVVVAVCLLWVML